MKGSQDPSYDLEELRDILAKAGLIKREATLDVRPYQPAFARRTAYRKTHYLVSSEGKAVCHLIAGKDLASLHARAMNFSAACPKLACRPLLYHEGRGSIQYLCLEHFSGESLDVGVQSGRLSVSEWQQATRRAQDLLERTTQPSTPSRLRAEVEALLKDACAFPGLSGLDARLLLELARPVLLEAAANAPVVERWSTGDFVGRNLLIDVAGDLRLIDYDHAATTHFGGADWLRLMQFSVLPPGLDASSIKELNFTARPAHEVYLWLHQLSLLRDAEPTEETKRHIASTVRNLFAAIERADGQKPSALPRSYLIGALLDHHHETEAALHDRTAWAKSLDQQLQMERQVLEKLSAEHSASAAWAKSLDTELQKAHLALATQIKQFEERTAWAQSLEKDLATAQGHFEKLTAQFTERTAWAQTLEAKLNSAQTSFAKLSADYAERSAWAQKLEQELHSTQASFAKLAAEHAERTAWALSLQAEREDLQRKNADAEAANTQLAEVLASARSREQQLARVVERTNYELLAKQRNILQHAADVHAARSALVAAHSRDRALAAETVRLRATLGAAQQHIDNLLAVIERLQQVRQAEGQTQRDVVDELTEQVSRLRAGLDRYEASALCRFAARLSGSSTTDLSS